MERPNPRVEAEDALLVRALAAEGIVAERVPWTRPAAWASFDLAVIRTTWDYTERLPEFLAWVDATASATRVVNAPEVVRWNAHKSYLLDLQARGVPVVPTRLLRRGEEARLDDVAGDWKDVVVKGAVDAGARRAWHGAASDGEARLRAALAEGDVLVQPFLPEVATEGEASLVFVDGRFSHAVRKRPAAGDWRVQAQWGGVAAPATPSDEEMRVARAALEAVATPTLHARVDLVAGRLMELELIEPYLFLDAATARTLAAAIARQS